MSIEEAETVLAGPRHSHELSTWRRLAKTTERQLERDGAYLSRRWSVPASRSSAVESRIRGDRNQQVPGAGAGAGLTSASSAKAGIDAGWVSTRRESGACIGTEDMPNPPCRKINAVPEDPQSDHDPDGENRLSFSFGFRNCMCELATDHAR